MKVYTKEKLKVILPRPLPPVTKDESGEMRRAEVPYRPSPTQGRGHSQQMRNGAGPPTEDCPTMVQGQLQQGEGDDEDDDDNADDWRLDKKKADEWM